VLVIGTGCLIGAKLYQILGIGLGFVKSGGVIWDDCPLCGQDLSISPGQSLECSGCGNLLAACADCGAWVTGDAIHQSDGGDYLCSEHFADRQWQSEQLKQFAQADASVDPSPRSVAAQKLFESKVRETYASKGWPAEVLFEPAGSHKPDQAVPTAVTDAYRFYERAVMQNDFGWVGIFRWDLDDSPIFIVRCDSDGSDGWLEIYDADGTPLGYARTDWDCPVWTSRNKVRRRTMAGDPDETDRQMPAAVNRLKEGANVQ
jgi:hypothetical protein